MKVIRTCILFTALISGVASTATADSVFLSYTGNLYTNITGSPFTTDMSVSATVELATALPDSCIACFVTPEAFNVSDGEFTLSDSSADLYTSEFVFWTDATGDITFWNFNAQTIPDQPDYHLISSQNTPGNAFPQDIAYFDAIQAFNGTPFTEGDATNAPGTWEVVPEPSSLLLLAIGTAGLTACSYRRWQPISIVLCLSRRKILR